jgi:hypothetical protein
MSRELTPGAGTATPGSERPGDAARLAVPDMPGAGDTTGGVSLGYTAALEGRGHTAWGPAAEQTAPLSEPGGERAGAAQASKWGLVPGGDDTLELNLGAQGAAREPSALRCISACDYQRPCRTRAAISAGAARCSLGLSLSVPRPVSILAREPERDHVTRFSACLQKGCSGGLQGGG